MKERQIKFRVWDDHYKVMIYPSSVLYKSGEEAYAHLEQNFDENVKKLGPNEMFYDNDSDGIMQFTGLKDSQGNDIYEGDLIKLGDQVFEVRYGEFAVSFERHDMCLGFYLNVENDFQIGLNKRYLVDEYKIEVVGNIFEALPNGGTSE